MKIYLAGPDVFLPDAVTIGQRKRELCAQYGHQGLFPLDNPVDLSARDASLQIFRGNRAMMDEADAIIANLTPFRGPSADAGTVFELGYMTGERRRDGGRKICLGYSNDPLPYAERTVAMSNGHRHADGHLVDAKGHVIEDFQLADNLMIVHALEELGHPLVTADPARGWSDLSLFEECLRRLNARGT